MNGRMDVTKPNLPAQNKILYRKKIHLTILSGFICLVIALSYAQPAIGKVKSVDLNIDLPARVWKAFRLKNLPQKSSLQVSITGAGEVKVFLLDSENYDSFPKINRPLFQGDVGGRLSFSIKIPEAGDYFLVLRNFSSINEASMEIKIQAASESSAFLQKDDDDIPKQESFQETLNQLPLELQKILIFQQFNIKTETCDKESAYAVGDSIVLCFEFVQKVHNALKDKAKTSYVLFFSILHEAAHILLKQWDYPFYDNEDVADEFATTLFILTNQRTHLTDVMEYFLSSEPSDEMMAKAVKGDRHQLSIQRARNIQEWANDQERFNRWMNMLIPHLQTHVLKKLLDTKPSVVSEVKLKKELNDREKSLDN